MIPLIPVVSSQIAAVGYDARARELVIQFRAAGRNDERLYAYGGVPPELAAGLVTALSPGSFFHRHIRNAGYPCRRLDDGGVPDHCDPGGPATRLPERHKPPRMGVRVPVQKIWPRHRRWVKSHRCCVPACRARGVDFAHLRSAATAGKDQKPHDMFGVSLCRPHHEEQHRLGADAFGDKYRIDLWAFATEFARRSPDWEMRASLKLVPVQELGRYAADPAAIARS